MNENEKPDSEYAIAERTLGRKLHGYSQHIQDQMIECFAAGVRSVNEGRLKSRITILERSLAAEEQHSGFMRARLAKADDALMRIATNKLTHTSVHSPMFVSGVNSGFKIAAKIAREGMTPEDAAKALDKMQEAQT
jgi:hypothetical protein